MEHGVGLFHAIEQSGAALYVRDAVLLYPVANVLHVLAVLVFFASVAVMDLRVLELIAGEPVEDVFRRFRRIAIGALAVLIATGLVLFVPEAGALSGNRSFQIKAVLVVIGLVNVGLMGRAMRDMMIGGAVPAAAKASAAASLLIWLAVAAAGRFIAYA